MACTCGVPTCKKSVARCAHGSYSMYVNHGCRCSACREANAAVGRKRYEKVRKPKPDSCGCGNPTCERRTRREVKHGLSAYFAHDCRCLACVTAMREYQQKRRATRRAAKAESTSA